jgi:hypothetical protein
MIMADMVASIRTQQQTRIKALTFPREHGAWGLLLIPLITGACVGVPYGRGPGNLILFITAALAIFWLRTPMESYFGMGLMRIGNAEERKAVLRTIAVLAPVVALSVGGLLWNSHDTSLLILGCVGATAFAVQSALRLFGRKFRMISQAIGSIGLTSTAAGAYYAVTGRLDERAMAVWFACWLFAGDQIHYVQLRLRHSKLTTVAARLKASRNFLVGQVVMLGVVAATVRMNVLPVFALIAFVPVMLRGFTWLADKRNSLDLTKLGVSELFQSVGFGALLVAAFYIHI